MTKTNRAQNIFHLAIPAKDLDASSNFYLKLGCDIKRVYHDHITINFFKHQLVLHKNDNYDRVINMYPRHFGVNLLSKNQWKDVWQRANKYKLSVYREPFERFEGKKEHHWSFFLTDPSNNVLEFKHYSDKECIY